MKATLINPNSVIQRSDFFGTGIPYMPIMLAYTASYLREKGHDVNVIDAFGENPFKKRKENGFLIYGLSENETISKIKGDEDAVFLYADRAVKHLMVTRILRDIKRKFSKMPVVIVENSQAVTAYSLKKVYNEFFDNGADYIIYGEPERCSNNFLRCLEKKRFSNIPGLIFKYNGEIKVNESEYLSKEIDELPFPAWDLFPIENYWKLGYSHAPFNGKYLPLLTSRGCPLGCAFCVIPFVSSRKWVSRSPQNVIEEIKYYIDRYGVRDFHIEDLNPTTNRERIKNICREIINNGIKIRLKFASGVKLETLDEEAIRLLAEAGCDYLSFSPESGSKRVLKLMNKSFDHKHGIEMSRLMDKLGMKSQACFVLGFPGENDYDRKLTINYIKELTVAGVDEIALFIMTPVPGSKTYDNNIGVNISRLTFSPKWRRDYKKLDRFRLFAYSYFALFKIIYHPLKLLKQPFNLVSRKFDTKIEMTLYRVLKTHI